MKKYEVTSVSTGETETVTKREGNKKYGRDEFKEMIQGYLPNYIVVEIEGK